MDGKITSGVSEEDGGEKSEPSVTILWAHWRILTLRKYLMKFDVDVNMMVALSSTESKVCKVQQ